MRKSPAINYLIKSGAAVGVYRETSREWEVHFNIKRTVPKFISVVDGRTVKTFSTTSVLPIAPNMNNFNLKHDIQSIHVNEVAYVFYTLITTVDKEIISKIRKSTIPASSTN